MKTRQTTRADDCRLISRTLAGDRNAVNSLVRRLTPIIQARIARRLVAGGLRRDVRAEVEDFTQEVFLALLQDGGQVLTNWDPERGLSLDNFVGLVAERQAISLLRTGKRNPWREDGILDDLPEPASAAATPASEVLSRDLLEQLLLRMRERLSPLGYQIFEIIYIRQCTVPVACKETGLSADAIYAWRSRLRKLACKIQADLLSDTGSKKRTPVRGGS